jgi:hypothetical protein
MQNDVMFDLRDNYLLKNISRDLIESKKIELIPYAGKSYEYDFEGNDRPYRPGVYIIWLNGIPIYVGESDNIAQRLAMFIGRCNGTRHSQESHSAGDYIYYNFTRLGNFCWKKDLTVSVLSEELYNSLIKHDATLLELETFLINTIGSTCNKQQTSIFKEYVEMRFENTKNLLEYSGKKLVSVFCDAA